MTKFYLLTATLASLLILAACGGGGTPPARANCTTDMFNALCNDNAGAIILRNQACTADPTAHGLCTTMAQLGGVLVRYCADNPTDNSVGCSLTQFDSVRIPGICPENPFFAPLCLRDAASLPARVEHCSTGTNASTRQCTDAFDAAAETCLTNPFTEACDGATALGTNADRARTNRFAFCQDNANATLCAGYDSCVATPFADGCGAPFEATQFIACGQNSGANNKCTDILNRSNAATWIAGAGIGGQTAGAIPAGTAGFLIDAAGSAVASAAAGTDIARQGQIHLGTELRAVRDGDDENTDRTIGGALEGDTNNGVAFYTTVSGNRYAGLFASTDLGAPIANTELNGVWRANLRVLATNPESLALANTDLTITSVFEYEVLDFDLNVVFGGRGLSALGQPTAVGQLNAFVRLTSASETHLVINGWFDNKGFITGTTVADNFAGATPDRDTPNPLSTVRTTGTLNGLISQQGAVAAFYSSTASPISHVGGFVATATGVDEPAVVGYNNWQSAAIAPAAAPNTTRTNQFLRGAASGLLGTDATDDDEGTARLDGGLNLNTATYTGTGNDAIALGGDAPDALAFYRFDVTDSNDVLTGRHYYAGILSGTDLGQPIATTAQGGTWSGALSYILGGGEDTITRDMTLTVDFLAATVDGLVKANADMGDTTHFVIDGTFFNTGGGSTHTTGTRNEQVIEGTVTYGEYDIATSAFDTTNIGTSAGVLSGLIGQQGAIGVFVSGTSGNNGAITANASPLLNFAGGFVVAPPARDGRANYDDWLQVASPAAAISSPRENQFVRVDASGALVGAADAAPASSGTVDLNNRGYGGIDAGLDVDDSVAFYRVDDSGTNRYYAGLGGDVSLGAPLTATPSGEWKGILRFITDAGMVVNRDMLLTVRFDTQFITSLVAPSASEGNTTTHFQLTGNFNNTDRHDGVISGDVIFGHYITGVTGEADRFQTRNTDANVADTTYGTLTGLIGQDGALGVFYSTDKLPNGDTCASGRCTTGFVGGFVAAPVVNVADWLDSFETAPINATALTDGAGFARATASNTILATGSSTGEFRQVLRFNNGEEFNVRPSQAGDITGVALLAATSSAPSAYFASALTLGTDLGKPLPAPTPTSGTNARWDGRVALLHGNNTFTEATGTFNQLFDLCLNFATSRFASRTNSNTGCTAPASGTNGGNIVDNKGDEDATNDDTLRFSGGWDGRGRLSGTVNFNAVAGTLNGVIGSDGIVGAFISDAPVDPVMPAAEDVHYAGGFVASADAEDPAVNYRDWLERPALIAANVDGARFTQTAEGSSNRINVHSTHSVIERRVLRLTNSPALLPSASGAIDGVALIAANGASTDLVHFASALTRGTDLGEPITSVATLGSWAGRASVLYGSNSFAAATGVFDELFELCLNFATATRSFVSQANGEDCFATGTPTVALSTAATITNDAGTNTLSFAGTWDEHGVIETTSTATFNTISGELRGLIGQDGAVGLFQGSAGTADTDVHYAGGFVASPTAADPTRADSSTWRGSIASLPSSVMATDGAHFAHTVATSPNAALLDSAVSSVTFRQVLQFGTGAGDGFDLVDVSPTAIAGVALTAGLTNASPNALFATGLTRGIDLGAPATGGNRSVRWRGRVAAFYGTNTFDRTTDTTSGGVFNEAFDLCINLFARTFVGRVSASNASCTSSATITNGRGATLSFSGGWAADSVLLTSTAVSFSDGTNTGAGSLSGLVGTDGIIGAFVSTAAASPTATDFHYAGGFVASPTAAESLVAYSDWTAGDALVMAAPMATPPTEGDQDGATFSVTASASNSITPTAESEDNPTVRILRFEQQDLTEAATAGTDAISGVSLLAAAFNPTKPANDIDPDPTPGDTAAYFAAALTRGTNLGAPITDTRTDIVTWKGRAAVFYGNQTFTAVLDEDPNNPAGIIDRPFTLCLDFGARELSSQSDSLPCGTSTQVRGAINSFAATVNFLGTWDASGVISGTTQFKVGNESNTNVNYAEGVLGGLIGRDGAIGVFASNDAGTVVADDLHYVGGFVANYDCDDAANAFDMQCADSAMAETNRGLVCEAEATAWDTRCNDDSPFIAEFRTDRNTARGAACVAQGIAADARCADNTALQTHCQGQTTATAICSDSSLHVTACASNPFGTGCVALPNIESVRASWCIVAGNTNDNCPDPDANYAAWVANFDAGDKPPATVAGLTANSFLSIADGETAIDTTGLNTGVIGGTTGGLTREGDSEDGFSYAGGLTAAGGSTPLYFAGILPTTDLGNFLTRTSGTAKWVGNFSIANANMASLPITLNLSFTNTGGTIAGLSVETGVVNSTAYNFALAFTPTGIVSGDIGLHRGTDATGNDIGDGTISGLIGTEGLVGVFISDAGSGSVFSGGLVAAPLTQTADVDYNDWLELTTTSSTPNTATRANQFLEGGATGLADSEDVTANGRNGGDGNDAKDVSRPDLVTLNLATATHGGIALGGSADNGIGFYFARRQGAARYATIFSGTNLDAPITNPDYDGMWNASFYMTRGDANSASTSIKRDADLFGPHDFDLEVDYTSNGGTVDGFVSLGGPTWHFLIDGDFDDRGVISGTTTIGDFAGGEPGGTQSGTIGTGVLSGLIGQDGALGVFISDTTTLGDASYAGGFVAVPPEDPNVTTWAERRRNVDASLITPLHAATALPTYDPSSNDESTRTVGFISGLTANAAGDDLNDGAVTAVSGDTVVRESDILTLGEAFSDTTSAGSGVGFFRNGTRIGQIGVPHFYAGVLAGTDLVNQVIPAAVASGDATASWDAKFGIINGVLSGNFIESFDAKLFINYTDKEINTSTDGTEANMGAVSFGSSKSLNMDANYTNDGIIYGTMSLNASGEANTGAVTGLIGSLDGTHAGNRAVGAFISSDGAYGTTNEFSGGFVAQPTP